MVFSYEFQFFMTSSENQEFITEMAAKWLKAIPY